jgi:hypothetical protein
MWHAALAVQSMSSRESLLRSAVRKQFLDSSDDCLHLSSVWSLSNSKTHPGKQLRLANAASFFLNRGLSYLELSEQGRNGLPFQTGCFLDLHKCSG